MNQSHRPMRFWVSEICCFPILSDFCLVKQPFVDDENHWLETYIVLIYYYRKSRVFQSLEPIYRSAIDIYKLVSEMDVYLTLCVTIRTVVGEVWEACCSVSRSTRVLK